MTEELRSPDRFEFPLSFAQQRLWFLDQLEGPSAAYNVRLPVRMTGAINVEFLQRAVDFVVDRHESLRTTFRSRAGEPMQSIASDQRVILREHDLGGATESEVIDAIGKLAGDVFRLDSGPLLRVDLLQLDEQEHLLLLVLHHIIADAWSASVLFQDIACAYDALAGGDEPNLPELAIQYADYAGWQRDWLAGSQLDRQIDYWRRQLALAPTLLEWPADRARPRRQTYNGSRILRELPRALTDGVKALAASESCTLFMTLLAAFNVLMSRYTGSDDVIVGTPIAGRRRTELEPLIGLFVNTVVLRANLEDDPPFAQLLAQVRETALNAFANQDLPFEKLVEVLQPARDMGHSPVFQTMFILQNAPWEAQPIRGVHVSPGDAIPGNTSKYDLTLSAAEYDGSLWLSFEYNTDLFDVATIDGIADGYVALLDAVVANPRAPVTELPVHADESTTCLLDEWNATQVDYDRAATVDTLVASHTRRSAAATAVECAGGAWTYADLAERADALATRLRSLESGAGVPVVAIFLDRALTMPSTLLGIARAGAAFLPLDPQYPPERIAFMLEDAGAAAIVTTADLDDCIPPFRGAVVVIDDDGQVVDFRAGAKDVAAGLPSGTAYIIYTSGSTGRPKGVCVPHSALVNFLFGMQRVPGIESGDRLLAVTTLSFDIALLELLLPLTVGATTIITPRANVADGRALCELIATTRPSVMQATPSTWRMLIGAGWNGAPDLRILCGGEPLDRALADALLNRSAGLWNLYGPTETTIWSTCARVDSGPITVGKPIMNTRVYVLDAPSPSPSQSQLRPLPIGVAGELYIGGDGLASGYHARPELTAAQFVADPFTQHGRMYRTGDRARWRSDGSLELLGRLDRQVKLRGFRIELGEIEAALDALPGVAHAAVISHSVAADDQRLVAYVVADDSTNSSSLRAQLRAELPDYMVPALIVPLPALPLTPNGKLDRRALPTPEWSGVDGGGSAPRDAVEHALAGMFARVIGVQAVGVHDNFFDLGGHSLLATKLVARIRDAFAVELPLHALFDSPTVAGVAEQLRSDATDLLARRYRQRRERPVRRDERYRTEAPLSFVQQRMWFLDQLEPGNPVYNLVWAVSARGELDVTALEQSVACVVARHEALRTSFASVDGEPVQRIASDVQVPIVIENLCERDDFDDRDGIAARLAAIARRPFDLATGPLLRVHVLRLSADEHALVVVMHHIVADGWSMAVLFRELADAYAAYLAGRAPALPALAVQYADYALWQREWLAGGELERQLDYWRQQLADAPAQLMLPTDRPRPPVQTWRGARLTRSVAPVVLESLHARGREHGCTLFMVLLAAFDAVLARYTGAADIVVGTPIAGRGRTELEGLIGFFVNTLVLRTDVGVEPRLDKLLERVQQVALDAYAHQDVPFERIVDELKPDRNTGRTPIFQVMFNLHNEPSDAPALEGLDVSALGVARDTAKFDLTVSLSETAAGLFATLEYNSDLFDAATMVSLGDYYVRVLESVAADPGLRLSAIPAAAGAAAL
ncbi:MAG: amino acid adenylation domain-containing protein, partial [Gammaproteobacteria bacterium]